MFFHGNVPNIRLRKILSRRVMLVKFKSSAWESDATGEAPYPPGTICLGKRPKGTKGTKAT